MDYNKIEILRKQRKLTQEALAIKAGMSIPGYQNLYKKHSTTVKTLEKLSVVLNVPMSYWWEDDSKLSMVEDGKVDYLSRMEAEIRKLESQLVDKQKLIVLLEEKLNAYEPKKREGTSGL